MFNWKFLKPIKMNRFPLNGNTLKAIVDEASGQLGQSLKIKEKSVSKTGCAIIGLEGGGKEFIARISIQSSSPARLRRNIEVLQSLEAAPWATEDFLGRLPRNILEGEIEGHFYCMETRLPGKSGLEWRHEGLKPELLTAAGLEFLMSLNTATRTEAVLDQSAWRNRIAPVFRQVGSLAHRMGRQERFTEIGRFVEDRMVGKKISFVYNHGNYWLGNILFDPEVRVTGVVDWDLGEESGLPMVDLIHLIFREESRTQNLGLGETIMCFLEGIRDSGNWPPMVKEYCSRMELDLDLVKPLVFCHWIKHVSQHIRHRTPALSNKNWLRRNFSSVLDGSKPLLAIGSRF